MQPPVYSDATTDILLSYFQTHQTLPPDANLDALYTILVGNLGRKFGIYAYVSDSPLFFALLLGPILQKKTLHSTNNLFLDKWIYRTLLTHIKTWLMHQHIPADYLDYVARIRPFASYCGLSSDGLISSMNHSEDPYYLAFAVNINAQMSSSTLNMIVNALIKRLPKEDLLIFLQQLDPNYQKQILKKDNLATPIRAHIEPILRVKAHSLSEYCACRDLFHICSIDTPEYYQKQALPLKDIYDTLTTTIPKGHSYTTDLGSAALMLLHFKDPHTLDANDLEFIFYHAIDIHHTEQWSIQLLNDFSCLTHELQLDFFHKIQHYLIRYQRQEYMEIFHSFFTQQIDSDSIFRNMVSPVFDHILHHEPIDDFDVQYWLEPFFYDFLSQRDPHFIQSMQALDISDISEIIHQYNKSIDMPDQEIILHIA